ncbi:MAG: hypothetical protein Q7Q73_00855 [Verrucomicrobiota bacterium JB024]|nr:hypothetical protein [Verrucomicrobiota bacterium JB024]
MKILLVILIFILSSGASHAALSIVVNVNTKTLSIQEQDSGSAAHVYYVNPPLGEVSQVFWLYGGTSGNQQIVDVQDGIEQTTNSAKFRVYSDGSLSLLTYSQDSSLAQINGTGAEISYASLSAPYQSILEGSSGLTLSLDQGSGYSSVLMTVVPEPSYYVACIGALTTVSAVFVRYRNRR